MNNRLKVDRGGYFVPVTIRGPKPGDFPVGSLQSRAAARAILIAYADEQRKEEEAELGNLTPLEQVAIEDTDSSYGRIFAVQLLRHFQEMHKRYGTASLLLTPEEFRHRRAIVNEIDRMTGGHIYIGDSTKWNQLWAIAEENLRAKEKSDNC
jgi:hypothetical protein